MSLTQLAAGKYLIDWRDSLGKRHRKKVSGSKKYAQEVELIVKQKRENEILSRKIVKITFNELADYYGRAHSGQTRAAQWTINLLKAHFGSMQMHHITGGYLQHYYNNLLQTHKSATCNRYFAVLGAIINYAIRQDKWNGLNPCLAVHKKTEKPLQLVTWSEQELNALLKGAQPGIRQVVLCAYHSGMSRSEIFALHWENVDMKEGYIHILTSPSGKPRLVPMSKRLKKVFIDMGPKPSGPVVQITLRAFECAFKRLKAKKKLSHLKFRDLRHTFATNFRMRNGDLADLQGLLGHTSLRMTNRYAHINPEELKKAISCMDD